MSSLPGILSIALLPALVAAATLAAPAAAAVESPAAAAHSPAPERLVVLDFELIGDLGDTSLEAEHRERVARISAALRESLAQSGLYEIADPAPAADLIERLSAHQHLRNCNGCEFDIARALDARYVMVPWVFRVSNLILTMHAEIRDAATGAVVMKQALDFRGDNDKAWHRAAAYLVRDMKERGR